MTSVMTSAAKIFPGQRPSGIANDYRQKSYNSLRVETFGDDQCTQPNINRVSPRNVPHTIDIASNIALPRRAVVTALFAAGGGSVLLEAPPAYAVSSTSSNLRTFTSSEGFTFDYPSTSWVVAFDRSGGRGSGAVVSIGDFRRFLVISVFRTVEIPVEIRNVGLNETVGRELCLDTQRAAESTMRFKDLGSSIGQDGVYNFEYEMEVCRGEIQEGKGGILRCMGSSGQAIPTQNRHHLGRAVLGKDALLTMMASAPVDDWAGVAREMENIVSTFRAS